MQQFIVEIHKGTLEEDEKHGREKEKRNTERRFSLLNLWFGPKPDQGTDQDNAGIKGTWSGNVYDCIYICLLMYVSSPRRAAGKYRFYGIGEREELAEQETCRMVGQNLVISSWLISWGSSRVMGKKRATGILVGDWKSWPLAPEMER